MPYEHIIRAVFDEPWAIMQTKLDAICALIQLRAAGGFVPQPEIDAIVAASPRPAQRTSGAVAVIPVFGVIAQRMNLMTQMSGGTSTEALAGAFREAVNDDAIGSIILNIDSPGGSVYGVQELADVIYGARGRKPVVAVANSLAASAAYWLGSQADEFVVTPSGEAGSIGVIASHIDQSAHNEAEGVRVSYITAGKFKAEGNPDEPLTDEGRGYIQSRVDAYYADFVKAVARGRGVKVSDVTGGMGEGRVVGARDAVRLGMADRVEPLEATIARLQSGRGWTRGRAAAEGDASRISVMWTADPALEAMNADLQAAIDKQMRAYYEKPTTTDEAVLSDTPEAAPEGRDSAADLDRRRRRLRLLSHG